MRRLIPFLLFISLSVSYGKSADALDELFENLGAFEFEKAGLLIREIPSEALRHELSTLSDLLYYAGQTDSTAYNISLPANLGKRGILLVIKQLNKGYFELYYSNTKGDAFKFFHQALEMAKDLQNKPLQRAALLGILEYYHFEIAQNSRDQMQYLQVFQSLATSQTDKVSAILYGMVYHSKSLESNWEEAYFRLSDKLDVYEEQLSKEHRLLPKVYFEKALSLEIKEDLDGAATYYQRAHASARDYPFMHSIRFFSNIRLSGIAQKKKEFRQALGYVNKARSDINLADTLRSNYYLNKYASLYYNDLQQYDTAYSLLRKAYIAEYYLDFRQNTREVNRLNVVLETQQKEMENYKLRQNSLWLVIGLSLVLVLLAISFIGYKNIRYKNRIIEKEKDRSENLLLNILPAEIAEEIKLNGSAEAKEFDMVTVLFTDFAGFTSKSAKLSAKELLTELNDCFRAFDHICEKYGIEKIKTIGDAYMAASGLPVPSEDSVQNTILAAIEMESFVTNRIAQKQAKKEIAFEMRIGIHSGPVVAGIVGVKKFQYDIWGDTVNTASRMQSSGEVGKVNISQHTYELVKHSPQFTFKARGKISVKGKGEIEMYFVKQNEVA